VALSHVHLFKISNSYWKIDIEEYAAARRGEEELQKFCAALRAGMLQTDVTGLIEGISSLLPKVDVDTLLANNNEIGQWMIDSIREALKNSCDGWVDDDLAFLKPWGFELSEIKVPVLLYHGSDDKMAPFAHGQWLAEHLPQEKLNKHLLQGEGHLSILSRHVDSMIDELLEIAKW